MCDYVWIEGHEVPGVDPKKLKKAQSPVRKVMDMDGKAVYEDGDFEGRKTPFQTNVCERILKIVPG